MKIDFSDTELIALVRALTFVRFESREYESRFLAGSPFIAEIYKRAVEATSGYYKSKGIAFPDEWPAIESIKGYLDVVKMHIKDTENWKELDIKLKDSFVRTLIFPYVVSEETILSLIKFGDELHSEVKK